MSLKAIAGVFAALVTVAASLPAAAQGFDVQSAQNGHSPYPNIGRPYSVRVTTGAHTNAGFEKPLTDGDPNLKHWCWVPVTNYDQGYIRIPAGADSSGKVRQRPSRVYMKSGTAPLPLNPAYSKPWKPAYINYGTPTTVKASRHANSNVTGKLTAKMPFARAAGPAITKTYSGGYGDVSGRVRPTSMAMTESGRVSGKLLSRTR